jgi:hypothetical protein
MSRTLTSMFHNRRTNKIVKHYSDGTSEERDYVPSERAKRAVEILRERRKTHPSEGARILKETLDRLDADAAARDAEKTKQPQTGGDGGLMVLIGLARLFMLR